MTYFYKVAVNSPFNNSILSYSSKEKLKTGEIVEVPLGKKKQKGCILSEEPCDESIKYKDININEEQDLFFDKDHLSFLIWVSKYYQYPLGQLLFDILPKSLKRPRPLNFFLGKSETKYTLSPEQSKIYKEISTKVGSFYQALIHGVTGSGKSVIYFELIKKVLSTGKSVLFLLPEINLTPQFEEDIKNSIKAKIFSYHSGLSNSDRYGLWKLLLNDLDKKVIIGVRSSIFLPMKNLGLIIVDEEHDSSFKQEDRCPYNARDIAVKLAQINDCPIILGSATPSVESYHRFKNQGNKINYFPLKERHSEGRLPEVILVDCRKDETDKEYWPFVDQSLSLIERALEKKEQVLIFVNRLGFSSYLQCSACGHQFYCPNCTVPLKFFKKKNQVKCQTCDYSEKTPEICPDCGNLNLLRMGFGTERLQEVLSARFSKHKVARFDRDDVTTFSKLEERLGEFHRGEIDIMVGTQMLAKGHNFRNVNLVIILGADGQLNFPDFRSNERVYQLLTQVAGRAGRFGKESSVIVQTLNPENQVFQFVKEKSFDKFYDEEIEIREQCLCPPFSHLIILYFTSKFQAEAAKAAQESSLLLRNLQKELSSMDVLGPTPASVEKRVNKYTWYCLIRSSNRNDVHNALKTMRENLKYHYSVQLKFDIDPYHTS